jgi:hypothetical protein
MIIGSAAHATIPDSDRWQKSSNRPVLQHQPGNLREIPAISGHQN